MLYLIIPNWTYFKIMLIYILLYRNSTTSQYFIKEIEEHVKYHGPK